jgi:beta-glucosidase-like glycosyl hydrolase
MTLARLVLPALRWRRETGFLHEEPAIEAALELGVGGFIIFGVPGARAGEVMELTERLVQAAGRPLLLAADLERGAGQQARRLTEIPPPAALASLDDSSAITWAGTTTAREARSLGLNWVFAPVADLDLEPENPIVQTRSFGADPAKVAAAVETWVRAAESEGVLACAKHYPGHGRTRVDSHDRLPTVDVPLATLEETDLWPFRAAVAAGVSSVMTCHVAFPAWDPSGPAATLSPAILGHLRNALGFKGLVVTDALVMAGAQGGRQAGEAEVAALGAGCDLLLYPPDPALVVGALEQARADGTLPRARIEEALGRYEQALVRVAGLKRVHSGYFTRQEAYDLARRLLDRGLIRGQPPEFPDGFELEVVDDDLDGWYAPGPNDLVRRALPGLRAAERHGAPRVVLAFAEPRAAKGRAGFGPRARERLAQLAPDAALVVLFAHPRLAMEIPGSAPILLAWHRQPLMQEAVARWLVDHSCFYRPMVR